MKKQNIVGLGHGPCRMNAEYCIDTSQSDLRNQFVRKQGGIETFSREKMLLY